MTEIGADQGASSFAELDRQPAPDRVPRNRFFEIHLGERIEPHKLKRRDPNAKLVANLFERVIDDDVDLVDREIELTRTNRVGRPANRKRSISSSRATSAVLSGGSS